MTDNALSLAALNVTLLEAIQAGPVSGPAELAERAGLAPNHIHRKLESLSGMGLIAKTGEGSCDVEVTEAGKRALEAMTVWRDGPAARPGSGVQPIPFNWIIRWAGNPRTQFDPAGDEEMAISIADKGVLQPIIVRQTESPSGEVLYEVIIGERRRRGAALAVQRGLLGPRFCIPCDVREISDDEAEEIAGVENIQREDMHWMDEAKWFLKLAQRLSAPAIERLIGGQRKKRSIQDYIKCARELSPADVARCYLPDGDKDQLTYVRARDLTGEKKERPALDLSPKVARAFLELIACGLEQEDREPSALPPIGSMVTTVMGSPPSGGPLDILSREKKLTTFGFEGRALVARTILTETVMAWLNHPQINLAGDPHGALYRVRAAEVGEMAAGSYRAGEWLTPELNAPKAVSPPPPPAYSPPPAAPPAGSQSPHPETEAPQGAAATSPPPAQAPAELDPLPAMLEIVVVEIAHKLGTDPQRSAAGAWGVTVLADYYRDARVNQLVQGRKLMGVHPAGEKALAIQTDVARRFLVEEYGLEPDFEGRVDLDDAVLRQAQLRLLGAAPAQIYSTPWLNRPAPAEAETSGPHEDAMDAFEAERGIPAIAAAPPVRGRDQFAQDILNVTRESRAWNSLAGAAEAADALLRTIKGRSKPPKPEELDPVIRLLEAALEAVKPYRNDARDGAAQASEEDHA